jgi:hypothetical protein
MEVAECFREFKESRIEFPPTYKFVLKTNKYDLSRKDRMPSWCDRILYKLNEKNAANADLDLDLRIFGYDHIDSLMQSDHRPVYSRFGIKVAFKNNYFI